MTLRSCIIFIMIDFPNEKIVRYCLDLIKMDFVLVLSDLHIFRPSMHNVVSGWVINGQMATFDTIGTDQIGRNRDLGYQVCRLRYLFQFS